MANYWLHNGFLQVEGEKMAKSLGNFVTIHELLQTDKFGGSDWPGSVLRFAMLQTHYRQPLDWTVRGLEAAWHVLDDFFWAASPTDEHSPSGSVLNALEDDLNTPLAVAELHTIRQRIQHSGRGDAAIELARNLNFLGVDRANFQMWCAKERARVLNTVGNIEEKIEARNAARKAKDFKEADRIRDELAAMGIELKDAKDPKTGELVTTWEVAR
jgi:cysteinyl-tRNA synthetase